MAKNKNSMHAEWIEAKHYSLNHVDTSTTDIVYIGKYSRNIGWIIKKYDATSDPASMTYALIDYNASYTTYSTAWTARASLTYKRWDETDA